jgi:hypothetical protein
MGRLIALIYFHLVSVIALVLIIIGTFHIANYALNTTQYEKYPLQYEEDCARVETELVYSDGAQVTPVPERAKVVKQQCNDRMEKQRKQKQLDDLKNATLFPVIGLILFLTHFIPARRLSRDKK